MEAILIAISAYFFFAVTNLIDKYIVTQATSPKFYAFIVGAFSGLVLFLVPFGFLEFNGVAITSLALISGIARTFALFFLYLALQQFDASKIVPAVGGALPVFTFIFTSLFFGSVELNFYHIAALFLLIGGTILITLEKEKELIIKSLFLSVVAAFLLAFSFFGAKLVFRVYQESFLSGFVLVYSGSFIGGLMFLFTKEARKELFSSAGEKMTLKKKAIIAGNQVLGGAGAVLQNYAIYLAPLAFLPLINALEGFKYLFLLALAALLSFKYPSILKERFNKRVALQKISAVVLLIGGLFLLFLN